MRVETPQILWHNEGDSKRPKNAALMSVSMLESGLQDSTTTSNSGGSNSTTTYGHVLATAGYDNVIHLWKVTLGSSAAEAQAQGEGANNKSDATTSTAPKPPTTMFQKHVRNSSNSSSSANSSNNAKFEFLCSLARHEGPVNAVAFSPDGLHLATAGETGAVLIWSVPPSKRGGGNGRHYWACLQQEGDLQVRRVPHNSTSSVQDVSWSADSKRFVAGSYDHAVWVCENVNHSTNSAQGGAVAEDWRVAYHNGMDHTRHVQGVTYDPTGVYLASMSSDRSVRVYSRKNMTKKNSKTNKLLLQPASENGSSSSSATCLTQQQQIQVLLRDTKLELGRSKQIRTLRRKPASKSAADSDGNTADNAAATKLPPQPLLFADETTLGSFVRRLSWTTDGAFLVIPAGLWNKTYATFMFRRHCYDEPYRVLPHGLETPSVAVRPNPVLFQLPASAKENQSPGGSTAGATTAAAAGGLAYRSIFCVLTRDTVLIYDTFHSQPLAMISGLHYANLNDATWSADGHTLLVCSTDGYLSVIQFAAGELGEVYQPPQIAAAQPANPNVAAPPATTKPAVAATTTLLPPCEPGPVVVVDSRPAKKARRIAPTPVTMETSSSSSKRPAEDTDEQQSSECQATATADAVDKLTLQGNGENNGSNNNNAPTVNMLQPKKKKRIQPTLLASQQ